MPTSTSGNNIRLTTSLSFGLGRTRVNIPPRPGTHESMYFYRCHLRPLMISPVPPSGPSFLTVHDTSGRPTVVVSMGLGVIVRYMVTFFRRAHGGLDFIFNFNFLLFFIFSVNTRVPRPNNSGPNLPRGNMYVTRTSTDERRRGLCVSTQSPCLTTEELQTSY